MATKILTKSCVSDEALLENTTIFTEPDETSTGTAIYISFLTVNAFGIVKETCAPNTGINIHLIRFINNNFITPDMITGMVIQPDSARDPSMDSAFIIY